MSNSPVLIVASGEKSYVKVLRAGEQEITYVYGPGRKVQAAVSGGASVAQQFKDAGLAGKLSRAVDIDYANMHSVRLNGKSGELLAKYREPGKKLMRCFEIDVKDKQQQVSLMQWLTQKLGAHGFTLQAKPASVLTVIFSWPMAWFLLVLVVGGVLTASQLTGGVDANELGEGTNRRARQAQGVMILVVLIANTIGFMGSLLITLAILGALLLYMWSKFRNRPTITTLTKSKEA